MPDGGLRVAHALLEIKSLDADARTFKGIASTPTVDHGGDSMDPFGAEFKLPLPLMWEHGKKDIKDPVGWITGAIARADGIHVEGNFAKVDFPASLKDQLDRAWSLVKSRLVRGLSIGWRPLKGEPIKGSNAMRWTKWGWHELSAVAIGMNQEATIHTIKSIDQATRASSGTSASSNRPGASGTQSRRSLTMKSFQEQIADLGDQRAQTQQRIKEILATVNDDVLALKDDPLTEYTDLGADLKSIEVNIGKLQTALAATSTATPVSYDVGTNPERASRVRAGDFQIKSNLPPGTNFVRAVKAKVRGKIEGWGLQDVADYAKKTWPDAPEVAQYVKAAVGTGAAGNWAEALNVVRVVEGEFIELLRPATIIGRLGLRPAPFNTKMIRRVDVTSSANWVGNGAVKPVGEGDYDTVEILTHKIAEIIVLTEDLVLSSAIDAVEATRVDLIERIAAFADEQFTDPTVAAGANNPASVLNGVTAITPSGSTADDLRNDVYRLMNQFLAYNIPLTNVTLIMSSFNALGIAGLTNALGSAEFPGMSVDGGNINGVRVIVSNNVGGDSDGSSIVAVVPRYILLAQAGGIRVDMSREATISMTGGATADHSLWQRNEIGLRCEWFVSWVKAHAAAAQYIAGANYFPAAAA